MLGQPSRTIFQLRASTFLSFAPLVFFLTVRSDERILLFFRDIGRVHRFDRPSTPLSPGQSDEFSRILIIKTISPALNLAPDRLEDIVEGEE
ncbi:hypothetical protein NKH47_24485 [Mesorhizobium sp. M1060]|uniref:hypothetical protein n=1 Tax=Mesorhizobium sp. M1060 TaxID=2957052 RepID=UPI00333611EA